MDAVTDELVSKKPQTFFGVADERRARRQAFYQAICDAVASGLPSEHLRRLKTVVKVMHENVFRRVLVGSHLQMFSLCK